MYSTGRTYLFFPMDRAAWVGEGSHQAIGDIPYINKKWLDYLKLDVPTTTEELEQVLIAFRDNADKLEQEFDIEGGVIPDVLLSSIMVIRILQFSSTDSEKDMVTPVIILQ